MVQRTYFLAKFLTVTLCLSIALYACNNNDYDKTATTESSTETMVDTMTMPAATPMADTAIININNTNPIVTTAQTGTAKPNPAKKGLKGKASAKPEMPAKADAKMLADESGVYPIVDIMASFPNGYNGLQSYFDKNLEYPADATNEGVEGTVKVTFVVDENGKLISPQISGGNLGYGLEAEALRVVKKMPVWNPAKANGKNVKTRVTLPIRFQLI